MDVLNRFKLPTLLETMSNLMLGVMCNSGSGRNCPTRPAELRLSFTSKPNLSLETLLSRPSTNIFGWTCTWIRSRYPTMPWRDYIWTRTPRCDDDKPPTLPSHTSTSPDPTTTALPSLSPLTTRLNHWSTTTGLPLNILLPTVLLTGTTLLNITLYKSRLRRIPTATHIPPSFLRTRSLYGYTTSVGDGDNFRLFHTPGGRLAGWGWFPSRRFYLPSPARDAAKTNPSTVPPTARAAQSPKLETIHVRIAGVDAPELAHFGKPAQPHGKESLEFLKGLVLNRYVRVYLHRRDQYERVVASAYVATPLPGAVRVVVEGLGRAPVLVRGLLAPVEVGLRVLGWMWNVLRGRRRTDVALRMLEEGAAGMYEAKFGSEFGGRAKEKLYREAEQEAKRRGVGMWGGKRGGQAQVGWWGRLFGRNREGGGKVETPREFKSRMKEEEKVKK